MPGRNMQQALADSGPPANPLDYAVSRRDSDVMSMVQNSLRVGTCALALQPVVLANNTEKIAFYEGLIRVLDETGRIIPAAQFMGQIEDNTIGRDIDCASLKLGLDMLGNNHIPRISINVSARSLGDGAWRRILDTTLARNASLAERLILEITEESAMHLPELVIRFMEEMQPHGVAFALDDFGAGLTSLRYLKDFFFDLVKVDSCFVRNVQGDPDNQVIAEALITIAHQFEMFTVAEGVERPEEAAFLQACGVDCLQGYLYGVPKIAI